MLQEQNISHIFSFACLPNLVITRQLMANDIRWSMNKIISLYYLTKTWPRHIQARDPQAIPTFGRILPLATGESPAYPSRAGINDYFSYIHGLPLFFLIRSI